MTLSQVNETNLTNIVWNNFYDIASNNMSSVTVIGSNTPITIQNYVSSYTDKMLDTKTNYPIMIINSPDFSFTNFTFRDRQVDGTIEFEVITNQAESADKFKDMLNALLLTQEDNLSAVGIEDMNLSDTSSDHYERGGLKVHTRKMVWAFKFFF